MKKEFTRYSCEIPVAPDDVERFKKGCAYYNMTVKKRRGAVAFTVWFDDPVDLYWLGANMFGRIPETGIRKQVF